MSVPVTLADLRDAFPLPHQRPRPIVLVTGGRDLADRELVWSALDSIGPGMLIEGGATGADRLALEWAKARGVQPMSMPALWDRYGNGAGPRRNAAMVEIARRLSAEVLAFPGGNGTADCVAKARAAGLRVWVVEKEG